MIWLRGRQAMRFELEKRLDLCYYTLSTHTEVVRLDWREKNSRRTGGRWHFLRRSRDIFHSRNEFRRFYLENDKKSRLLALDGKISLSVCCRGEEGRVRKQRLSESRSCNSKTRNTEVNTYISWHKNVLGRKTDKCLSLPLTLWFQNEEKRTGRKKWKSKRKVEKSFETIIPFLFLNQPRVVFVELEDLNTLQETTTSNVSECECKCEDDCESWLTRRSRAKRNIIRFLLRIFLSFLSCLVMQVMSVKSSSSSTFYSSLGSDGRNSRIGKWRRKRERGKQKGM